MRIFEKMNFVYPGFLFALSAISIPIIIHLIQLRKYKRINFSNTQFLKNIQEEQKKSNKLKNLLILFARILSIIFLVLAFAQPYIPSNTSAVATGQKHVSIYIDNSFSMEQQGEKGILLDEAKRKAKEIVNGFSSNDRFQLLGNELNGNQRRWLNKESFLDQLSELKIRPETRLLKQIITTQRTLLNEQNSQSKFAFLISDFQNNFYNSTADVVLDSNINWNLVYLENKNAKNVSIDSIGFNSPVHQPNSTEELLIKINNHSNEPIENLNYSIKLNDEVIGKMQSNIEASASKIDTFRYKNRGLGNQKILLELNDAGLSFDNKYFASYQINKNKNISIIKGSKDANVIEKVFSTEPYFTYKSYELSNIDYENILNSEVIFLYDISEYSTGLLEQIRKALDKGITVVYFPSENEINSDKSLYAQLGLYSYTSIVEANTKIEKLNLNASIYKNLFSIAGSNRLDLPSIRKYFSFGVKGKAAAQDLIFNNLSESLLKYYKFSKGHIYQFAFQLNTNAGDFIKHAIIVPSFLRMASVHSDDQKLAYYIGKDQSIPLLRANFSDKSKKELQKNDLKIIPEIRNNASGSEMYLADQLTEEGIYTLNIDNSAFGSYAFNFDRRESDMSFVSLESIKNLEDNGLKVWLSEEASLTKLIKDESSGKRYWKICVILALIFIGLEILFIRAFK